MAATGEPEQTRKEAVGDSNFPARASYKTHGALPEILPVEGQLGPYELVAELGAGGMGSVFVATRMYAGDIKRTVALKTLRAHLIRRPDLVEMFMNEARIAARISHPYVCTVHDVGITEGVPYVAMDYLVGEPLSRILPLFVELPDQLSVACAIRTMAQLSEGLHAAHELRDDAGVPLDVVHRDISPDNLFVLYDGTTRVVDFGIALTAEHQRNGTSRTLLGKCAYMSPEQVRTQALDRRADIWSMGVVLWELLTGKRLFQRPSDLRAAVAVLEDPIPPPSTLNPLVPSPLDSVVLRALERDPTRRHASARELAKELERVGTRSLGAISASEVGLWLEKLFPGSHDVRRSIVVRARALLKKQEKRISVTSQWLLSRDLESDVSGWLAPNPDDAENLVTPVLEEDLDANAADRRDAARRRAVLGARDAASSDASESQIASWVREANVTHSGGEPIVTTGPKLGTLRAESEPVAGDMQEPARNHTASAKPTGAVSTRVRMEPVWRRVAPVLAIVAAFGGVAVVWAWPKRASEPSMRAPAAVVATEPSSTSPTTAPSAAPPKLEQPAPAGVPVAPALTTQDAPREVAADEPVAPITNQQTSLQTGQLYFATRAPDVTVKIAGRPLEKVPALLTLPAGPHVIEVQRSGGRPVGMPIQVVAGRTSVLQLD